MQVARRIEYIDFEQAAGAADPARCRTPCRWSSTAFARLLVLGDQQPLPAVKVFCYGNEVHYYVTFRNHPLFIRIDYSPPLAGGMIDLQYYGVSKYELDDHPEPELDAIQAFFRRLEFDVQVQNTQDSRALRQGARAQPCRHLRQGRGALQARAVPDGRRLDDRAACPVAERAPRGERGLGRLLRALGHAPDPRSAHRGSVRHPRGPRARAGSDAGGRVDR